VLRGAMRGTLIAPEIPKRPRPGVTPFLCNVRRGRDTFRACCEARLGTLVSPNPRLKPDWGFGASFQRPWPEAAL
jgi:hypothetical protein